MNLKKFFDTLGMNGTVWQWKIWKWKKNFSGQIRGAQFQTSLLLILANGVVAAAGVKFFGLSHLFSPHSVSLLRMGAFNPELFSQGEFWRIITYGYLHIGILHILMNMLSLSQVGPMLEEQIGKRRLFVIYTFSLVAGATADLIVRGGNSYAVIAGASGAIFGLIGFGISYEHFYGGPAGKQNRDFFFRWALYALAFGWLVHADNIAHLGGMVTGMILGPLIYKERRIRQKTNFLWTILTIVCLLATVASFVGLIEWNRHIHLS